MTPAIVSGSDYMRIVLCTSPPVELYDYHEFQLTNGNSYTNPFDYDEIALEVTVTRPDASQVTVLGFHDGDGSGGQTGSVWKARIMAEQTGEYSYTYAWTGTGTKPTGGSGSFRVTDNSKHRGALAPHTNPRWLTDARGTAVWPQLLYYHELMFQSTWQANVDTHVIGNGYNGAGFLVWQANVLVTNGWDNGSYDTPQFYPMNGGAASPDYTEFHIPSLTRMDARMDYLKDNGLWAYNFDGLFPNVGGSFPETVATETNWSKYYTARFGAFYNHVLTEAFEWYEFQTSTVMQRRAAQISDNNPFGLLVNAHDTYKTDASGNSSIDNRTEVDGDPLDVHTLHQLDGTAGTAAAGNAGALAVQGTFPVYSAESQWEGPNKLTAAQVRQGAWGGVMGAAALHLYGEFDIGGAGVGPLGAGSAHATNVYRQDFLNDLGSALLGLSPDNSKTNAGNYCLFGAGVRYLVYAPSGGSVDVDLTVEAGTWAYDWFNPRDGNFTAGATFTGGGVRSATAPDANDWILTVYPA